MTASVINSGISKINVLTDVGSGLFPGTREDIFIKTRAVQRGDGSYSYDILQTNANGGNVKVIGERVDGKIIFNNRADNDLKRFNNDKLIYKTSKDQITSIKNPDLDKDQNPNQAEGNGNNIENNSINLPVDRGEDKSRKNYGNYCYPVTLRRGNQDRLKITIKDRDLRNSVRLAGSRAPAKSIGSVVLPIPANLSDNNQVSFKSGTLNPLEVAAAEVALTALLNNDATGEEAKELLNQVTAGRGDFKSLAATLFTGRAINRAGNQLLARNQGTIVNPNLELLFDGPTLRPFNFRFRLSPRDRRESIEVKKIIRMFKQSSAVKQSASGFFLRAPNTYELKFFEGSSTLGSEHDFLPKIKECALLGFGVNYTPDGSFMSYENSSMVSYDLTFAFQELDPITNEDYSFDGNRDKSIGF